MTESIDGSLENTVQDQTTRMCRFALQLPHNTLNPFPNKPWFLRVCATSLSKTVGKGEIARNEQFLLFPLFSTRLDNFLPFSSN